MAANGFCQNLKYGIRYRHNDRSQSLAASVVESQLCERHCGKHQWEMWRLTDFVNRISKDSVIDVDDFSHSRDHCLEVQAPFLQFMKNDNFKIVPIILMLQDIETAKGKWVN